MAWSLSHRRFPSNLFAMRPITLVPAFACKRGSPTFDRPCRLQNSRMKDFYDIWILSRTLAFSGHGLSQAIRYTFQRRQTSVPPAAPVALTAAFYDDPIHVRQWGAFVRRIGEAALADDFKRVAGDLVEFLMVRRGCGHCHRGGPSGPLAASRPMAVDVAGLERRRRTLRITR